jgi:hypothetical protein
LTWNAVDKALTKGHWGLPRGWTLAKLLHEYRGIRHPDLLPLASPSNKSFFGQMPTRGEPELGRRFARGVSHSQLAIPGWRSRENFKSADEAPREIRPSPEFSKNTGMCVLG